MALAAMRYGRSSKVSLLAWPACLFWICEIVVQDTTVSLIRLIRIMCIVGVLVVTFLGGVYGAWHTKAYLLWP